MQLAAETLIRQVKNRLLPLSPLESALEWLVEQLPRSLIGVDLIPNSDIMVIDENKGEYKVTGSAPIFTMTFNPKTSRYNWYYLEAALGKANGSRDTFIRVEVEEVAGENITIPIPSTLRGSVREVFYLPANVKALYWAPTMTPGFFSQSQLLIHQITPLESMLRRMYRVVFDFYRIRYLPQMNRNDFTFLSLFFNLQDAYERTVQLRIAPLHRNNTHVNSDRKSQFTDAIHRYERVLLKIHTPAFAEYLTVPYRRKRLKLRKRLVPPTKQRRLLLDVSIISQDDAGTGIQRVVRSVFNELKNIITEDDDLVLCPIAATNKLPYSHIVWNGVGDLDNASRIVNITEGDVFLGLDFSTRAVTRHYHQLADWKRSGATLNFIVHDLLPEHYPQWFTTSAVLSYRRWIKAVVLLADCIFCNSQDTERKVLDYCQERFGLTIGDLRTCVLPMGWDITPVRSDCDPSSNFRNIISMIYRTTSVLMVGTLEPRKGHAQVLAAFEELWQSGEDCNLVIVGRSGWNTEQLQHDIRNHRELNNKLFWLENVGDNALVDIYRACAGVIVASLAEGYGLPMMEAIGHSKPVLVRDLAVFREQTLHIKCEQLGYSHNTFVNFFDTQDKTELARLISAWLGILRGASIAFPVKLRIPTWRDTAAVIVRALEAETA